MSKDIRSFFQSKGKKTEQRSVNEISNKKSKKRPIIVDSDSDEPEVIFSQKKKKSSVSDKSSSGKKQPEKLKIVDVSDIFGNEKVKRSAVKLIIRPKKSAGDIKSSTKEFELIHSDDDFEATLSQIDEIEENALNKEQKHIDSDSSPSEIVHKQKDNSTDNLEREDKSFQDLKVKKQEGKNNTKSLDKTFDNKKDKTTSGKSEIIEKNKHYREGSCEKKSKDVSPKSIDKQFKVDDNSPSDPAEKKRQQALSYMKYLQRGGPKHLGSKEIPVGKHGCLSGIAFVITGVLDSLERDEAIQLIEQYGGKVTSNVSRNTNYLICGEEIGHSKLSKAEKLGTPQINEDGLFDLIRSKSENTASLNVEHSSPKVNRKRNLDQKSNRDETCKEIKLIKTENSLKERNSNERDQKLRLNKLELHPFLSETITELDSQETSTKVCAKNVCSAAEKVQENSVTKSVNFDSMESSLWVDKYRPTKSKQVIGQQGDRSSLRKLTIWLQNWHKNHSGNKKHVKPSPWAKNDDGSFFKAALLSGPPGIGKTTMAHLVSKELGFDVVEFNASDTRSKKLLHMEISELLSSKTLFGYFLPGSEDQKPSVKHVLLMDEVDGMAGNEDRGGVQELIQLIKNTRVPIICMCNDRNHPKIRSLANYCFDLRVMKPRLEQIRGAMMSVCYKEGLKIPATILDEIIYGTNFDIRQILHHLSLWSAKDKQLPSKEKQAVKPIKDMKMGPWDVVKKVFSIEEHKTMSIHDKSNLFFHDYGINPLFVQENYLSVSPAVAKGSITKTLQCIASAAESISFGEIIEKCIRSKGSWNLLPLQAMFSSVIPGDLMEGYIRSQINFPAWLGKNSRTNKLDRLLQELHVHTRLSTSGSKQALNMEYLQSIRESIIHPLVSEGSAGVPETLSVLQSYNLLREDLESILELTQWPNQKDPMSAVESKVKAALTRAYNKEGILTPYSVMSVIKKRSGGMNEEYEDEDAEDGEDVEEDNDISVDAMIKTKKTQKNLSDASVKGVRGRGKNSESNSRGSQKRGRGRGRGK